MVRQTTLRREVEISGIGLHSGRRVALRLAPASGGSGVRFRRTDLGGAEIPATTEALDRCAYATNLRRGEATVATVEHLLSALYSRGVDNAEVSVDGPELPILDGSAVPFLDLIREAGVRDLPDPRRAIEVLRPIAIVEPGKEIVVYPAPRLEISYLIDFDHPAIGMQERTLVIDAESYALEVAPARTFTFVRDVEALRHLGLALGGSLTNAVVLDDHRLLNSTLRFSDEFVRHKILDLLGDLALLSVPLLGHVMAFKAGHDLHGRLVTEILARPGAWRWVEATPPRRIGARPAGAGSVA